MEKKDLGEVKISKRIKNGVEQTIRLFTKSQRRLILKEVDNRPDTMTIEDVLNLYDVLPGVYYTWVRSEKEDLKEEKDELPNPLADSFKGNNVFSNANQINEFYIAKSPELQDFIKTKFQEWLEMGLIEKINAKISSSNIKDVANAGNISVEELKSYLAGNTKNLSYFSIEGIRRYLGV